MFRWVGVAAPAQQCFQSVPVLRPGQWLVIDPNPGTRSFVFPRVAGKRPLMHNGGGCDVRAAMAWPPFQSPARAKPEASDLGSVTFGPPLDPVVGGSLEDAFCV